MASVLVYEDRWGEIIDRPDAGFVEIRWYDTTRAMNKSEFEQWLRTFAEQVKRLRRPGVLVDGTRFLTQTRPAVQRRRRQKVRLSVPGSDAGDRCAAGRRGTRNISDGILWVRQGALDWLSV
jgi:hypothetical protein